MDEEKRKGDSEWGDRWEISQPFRWEEIKIWIRKGRWVQDKHLKNQTCLTAKGIEHITGKVEGESKSYLRIHLHAWESEGDMALIEMGKTELEAGLGIK